MTSGLQKSDSCPDQTEGENDKHPPLDVPVVWSYDGPVPILAVSPLARVQSKLSPWTFFQPQSCGSSNEH